MWPVPIVGRPCRARYTRRRRLSQGKPVWSLNREHLAYLIDYLSADLREKPLGIPRKTQADHLPTFMKTAKNRERIVKLLKKMQEE